MRFGVATGTGLRHIRAGTPTQDAYGFGPNCVVIADGVGMYPTSHYGSNLVVTSFPSRLAEQLDAPGSDLLQATRGALAAARQDLQTANHNNPAVPYFDSRKQRKVLGPAYGDSTLSAVCFRLEPGGVFEFAEAQVGDGDILEIQEGGDRKELAPHQEVHGGMLTNSMAENNDQWRDSESWAERKHLIEDDVKSISPEPVTLADGRRVRRLVLSSDGGRKGWKQALRSAAFHAKGGEEAELAAQSQALEAQRQAFLEPDPGVAAGRLRNCASLQRQYRNAQGQEYTVAEFEDDVVILVLDFPVEDMSAPELAEADVRVANPTAQEGPNANLESAAATPDAAPARIIGRAAVVPVRRPEELGRQLPSQTPGGYERMSDLDRPRAVGRVSMGSVGHQN
ncbi:MAG TPA: protein phosphatase 2C domain-containing protein [Candidatus Saccharimonadales bacterium]|nr:protein phosphatase 2C domain-containing protein [Candidatus Saccharimonadales bacterium]